MSESEKTRPSHRVSFAAFERDKDGENKLGNAREIGAIWPRKDRDGEGILRFDHTPQQEGVYFVKVIGPRAAESARSERSARPRSRDTDRGR